MGRQARFVLCVDVFPGRYFDGSKSDAACQAKECLLLAQDVNQSQCIVSEEGFSEIHLWKDREDRVIMVSVREIANPDEEITVKATNYDPQQMSQQAQRIALSDATAFTIVFNFMTNADHTLTDIRLLFPDSSSENENPILTEAGSPAQEPSDPNPQTGMSVRSTKDCDSGCASRSVKPKAAGARAAFPPKGRARKRTIVRKRAIDVNAAMEMARDFGSALAVTWLGYAVFSALM